MKIVSVVTYNVKLGYSDDFIAAFDAPGGISHHANYQQLIQVSDTHFISMTEVDGVDEAVDKEDDGVKWLDAVDYLLVKYENGSGTDACSGLVVHSYENQIKAREKKSSLILSDQSTQASH